MGNSTNYTTRLAATQATNIIEVWEAADFGPLNINSRYDIDTTAKYIIKAPITIANGFDIPEAGICHIVAENRFLHPLTWTGTDCLFDMAGTRIQLVVLDSLTITQTSQTASLFNVDSNNVGAFQFTNISFNGGDGGIGTLSQFDRAVINQCVFQNFDVGIELIDVNVSCTNSTFENDTDRGVDPWVDIRSTIPVFVNFASVGFFARPTETVFWLNSTTQDAETRIQISDGDGENPADPGATFFDPAGLDQTDTRVNTTNVAAVPDSKNIGSFVCNNNATATTIGAANTWTDLNLNASAVAASNIEQWSLTNTTTGELTYNGMSDFAGSLLASISCFSTGGSQEFQFRVVKNGAVLTDGVISSVEIGADTANVGLVVPITAVETDTIRIQVQNIDGTSDITISFISVEIL